MNTTASPARPASPSVGVVVASLIRAGDKTCTMDNGCASPNHAETVVAAPRPIVGVAVVFAAACRLQGVHAG